MEKNPNNLEVKILDKITNQNARAYLEENLFPELRTGMRELLQYIQ